MSQLPIKLIYSYDPLCGWCYGLIPALRQFVEQQPEISIEVLPGGLFIGKPSRLYSSLITHIREAEIRLEAVTGHKPSEAFHAMISENNGLVAASESPSHAILQMNTLASKHSLEFAHLLQEAHYGQGKDLNDPKTYDDLCQQYKFPTLDTNAVCSATLADPLIAQSYERNHQLGGRSYPTVFVMNNNNKVIGTIQSIYDPKAFHAEFIRIRDSSMPS